MYDALVSFLDTLVITAQAQIGSIVVLVPVHRHLGCSVGTLIIRVSTLGKTLEINGVLRASSQSKLVNEGLSQV